MIDALRAAHFPRARRHRCAVTSAFLPAAAIALAAAPLLAAATQAAGTRAGVRADVSDLGFRHGLQEQLSLSPAGERKSRALATYYRGIREETSGDMEAAVTSFREVLEIDPGNLELAARTAKILANVGRSEPALAVLEQSLADNPGAVRAYLNLAEHCALFNNDDPAMVQRAKDYAREAIDRFPGDPRTYQQLAALHLYSADRDEASAVLEEALAQDDVPPRFWLAIGQLAQQVWPIRTADDRLENLERVNAIYERAVGSSPTTEAVADYFAATRQYDRAVPLYRQLIDRHPEDLDAREKVARVLRLADRHEEALEAFESLVAINPYDGRVRELLSEYYTGQKRLPEATTHLLEAIRLGVNSLQHYRHAAYLLLEQERVEEALDMLERAAILNPGDPTLPQSIALILAQTDRAGEGLVAYEKAEKIGQELISHEASQQFLDHTFYFQFGAIAEQAEEYEQAADLFRRSIDLVPEDSPELAAQAYNYLGYMWLELGTKIDEAGELIKFANHLDPDKGAYVDSLGWFYFLKGDYEEALVELQRAADLLGGMDSVVLDHVAQAQYQLGQVSEAVATLEKAAALDQEKLPDEIRARLDEYRQRAQNGGPDAAPASEEKGKPEPAPAEPAA